MSGIWPASDAEMDKLVDAWHTSSGADDLPTYCGLTRDEYYAWVEGRITFDRGPTPDGHREPFG